MIEVQEFNTIEEALASLSDDNTPSNTPEIEESVETINPLNPKDPFNKYVDQTSLRYSGAPWFEVAQKYAVTIVGIGGIGSNLAYSLARTGILELTLYDNDKVELVNLAGQLYPRTEVSNYKSYALRTFLNMYTNCFVRARTTRFDMYSKPDPVTFTGLDSMASRKEVFDTWYTKYQGQKYSLFVDGRLSFDTIQIFAFSGADEELVKLYRDKYLFDDSQADETICSMKQTTYLASMIGAMMTNIFINWCINQTDPFIEASVPFKTQFDSNLFMFM